MIVEVGAKVEEKRREVEEVDLSLYQHSVICKEAKVSQLRVQDSKVNIAKELMGFEIVPVLKVIELKLRNKKRRKERKLDRR